jgi:hypothetical protein
MSSQHKVVLLNQPARIYGYTPAQFAVMLATLVIAFIVATHVPAWKIAYLPVSFLIGMTILGTGTALVQATNVRSLRWWRKRIGLAGRGLPLYLPDFRLAPGEDSALAVLLLVDGTKRLCIKCTGIDMLKLDALQREDLASIFTNVVTACGAGVQIITTRAAGPSFANAFYLIFSGRSVSDVDTALIEVTKGSLLPATLLPAGEGADLADVLSKLRQAGLSPVSVTRGEMRKLLFAHLSPAHYARGDAPPASTETSSESLTLCSSGFEQRTRYVAIDDNFCATLRLSRFPSQTYVGWLRSLLSLDCRYTVAMHLQYCDQRAARRQVSQKLALLLATKGHLQLQLASESLLEMQSFSQGSLAAFDVAIYLTIFADSLDQLAVDIKQAKQLAANSGAVLETTDLEQLEGLISCLPIGVDQLNNVHRVLSPIVGTCWPFVA